MDLFVWSYFEGPYHKNLEISLSTQLYIYGTFLSVFANGNMLTYFIKFSPITSNSFGTFFVASRLVVDVGKCLDGFALAIHAGWVCQNANSFQIIIRIHQFVAFFVSVIPDFRFIRIRRCVALFVSRFPNRRFIVSCSTSHIPKRCVHLQE